MKTGVALAASVALLVIVSLLGVRYGPTDIGWEKVFNWSELTGQERSILWDLRIPRVIVAGLVGAALALSGVLLQGLFRNPMASPGIIGVSTGGALGATLAFALGLGMRFIWAVPFMAFGGALAAAMIVYGIATRAGRTPIATLILCGLAVNAITGALTSLTLSMSMDRWVVGRQILFWLMGGLNHASWNQVAMSVPFVAVCIVASVFFLRELNLMLAGEESAMALGVDTVRTKRWILAIAAAAAGAGVAVAGVIGFVGLIVPHIVRLVVGPDHRRLLPIAVIFGAAFLIGTDLASRAVFGHEEIRLGIVTSGLGGPFFLWLVVRYRRKTEVF